MNMIFFLQLFGDEPKSTRLLISHSWHFMAVADETWLVWLDLICIGGQLTEHLRRKSEQTLVAAADLRSLAWSVDGMVAP